MEVEFESPEQLAAFKRMQASHPEAVGRLLDQGGRLEARVAELEASQTPRPMSEAPKDGSEFVMAIPLRYRNYKLGGNVPDDDFFDRDGDVHGPEAGCAWGKWVIGWLPLPDQSGKGKGK